MSKWKPPLAVMAVLAGCILCSSRAADDAPYQPTQANVKMRQWFQDAKFGLFIHWGVYSVLGDGEWVMNNRKMSVAEYEKLPDQFNPTEFDAAEWVKLAKDAGMKYITITSKHHDGFAMWDSKVSDWDIVDRTPYKKDVLKLLADECKKHDIKLFFYHSHLDWRHADYFPLGQTGRNTGRKAAGDFNKYLDFMDAQLAELLGGHYGDIAGVWFDGWWDQQQKQPGEPITKTQVDWRLRRTYDLIHKLQPHCLIGNNHHVPPFPGEDFQMFEKDLPGGNTAGFNADATIGRLPLESCETINRAWGYNKNDKQFKSTKQLVHYLIRAAGHNANFLLNVGPMPTGRIQPEFGERLREIGLWTQKNGESVYGTRGGPMPPQKWGVTTQKGSKVYVHLLDVKPNDIISLSWDGISPTVRNNGGTVLGSGERIGLAYIESGRITMKVPDKLDPIDTVIVLDTAKKAE